MKIPNGWIRHVIAASEIGRNIQKRYPVSYNLQPIKTARTEQEKCTSAGRLKTVESWNHSR
jgi:hypothetical protein